MTVEINSAKLRQIRNRINKKTKLNIVFNPQARRDFLSGFHKRKLQRKKKALEELKQQLKEERKRLKQEARETYKKLVVSHNPIPELENLFSEDYEHGNHSVSIVELSTTDLAEKNSWIGTNKVQYETGKAHATSKKNVPEELPGMELKKPRDVKKVLKKQATKQVQNSKAYKLNSRLEQHKNKKKSLKMKKQRIKIRAKSKKGKQGKRQNTKHSFKN